MHLFARSRMSVTVSLLTLVTLLASVAAFQVAGPLTAHAATTSAPTTTLLKLQSLGTARLTAASKTTQSATSSDIEVRPDGELETSPKLQISGQTPPIAPPPAGTPAPNPAGLNVTSNNPGFKGFNGLSHFDQRNAGTGAFTNTQFSLEPPDQALCASNNFVLDSVNTALAVRTTNGTTLTGPTPINQFFGLAPEIIRSTPLVFGDFTSDPKCYFDPATQRWFLTVLQISVDPASGAMKAPTHTLIAVSQTSDPTGTWRTFAIDTTDDGSNGTPSHPNCPCLGDQPLIGANADGFFVSTNEFGLANGFNGAQVYAISKRGLVQAASNPGSAFTSTVVHIDASQALVPFGGLSFSIQPSTQPAGIPLGLENNGTEYFLSSLDFTGTVDNRIAVWALTNTRSLNQSNPNVSLTSTVIRSQLYGQPVPVIQKDGPTPEATSQGAPIGFLNSNDDRMNQVVFAAGVLWSGVNTIVQKPGEAARTGIAFFGVVPFFAKGQLNAILAKSGYVAVDGENVLFPSIGVNVIGEGVMGFTLSGPDFFPSAAYMPISLFHTGDVHVASAGANPEDGFTCVAPDRLCRWGDYSAAVASPDGRSIWLATEFIPNTPRTVLANWGTFISNVDV